MYMHILYSGEQVVGGTDSPDAWAATDVRLLSSKASTPKGGPISFRLEETDRRGKCFCY